LIRTPSPEEMRSENMTQQKSGGPSRFNPGRVRSSPTLAAGGSWGDPPGSFANADDIASRDQFLVNPQECLRAGPV
jgi:hypothetical protein